MKPDVITRGHIRIFWISIVFIAVVSSVLYFYARFVGSPVAGKQGLACEGAQRSLADLRASAGNGSAAMAAKLKDAEELAEIECSKDS